MVANPQQQNQINLAYSQAQLRSQGLEGMRQRQLEQIQAQQQVAIQRQQEAQQQQLLAQQQVQSSKQVDNSEYEAYQEALKHIGKGMGGMYVLYGENSLVKKYVKLILKNQGYTFKPNQFSQPVQEPLMLPRTGVNIRITPQGEIIEYKPTKVGEQGKADTSGIPFPRPYPTLTPIKTIQPTTQIAGRTDLTKPIINYPNKIPQIPMEGIRWKTPQVNYINKATEFFLTNKDYIGLGSNPFNYGRPYITGERIRNYITTIPDIPIPYKDKQYQNNISMLPIRALGTLIPTTPAEVTLFAGTPAVLLKSSPAVRTLAQGGITYLGGKQALNQELTPEERFAGGIVGTAGALGLASEVYPFVSGKIAKYNPLENYRPIEEEIINGKRVQYVKAGEEKIYLIREGNKQTGNTPAFLSTAYGFSPEYQAKYIGKNIKAVTSARGFFKTFEPTKVTIVNNEKLGIFFTPQDIVTGKAQTRVSRLGEYGSIFKAPSNQAKISFETPRPQIIYLPNEYVTKSGKIGTLRAIGKQSSELEVTALPSNVLNPKEKLGVTNIGGTRVELISAELRKGKGETNIIETPKTKGSSKLINENYISPSTLLSSATFGTLSPKPSATPSKKSSSISYAMEAINSRPSETSKTISPNRVSNFISISSPVELSGISSIAKVERTTPSNTRTNITKTTTNIFKDEDKRRRKLLLKKLSKAYRVFSRRKGKFFEIARNVSREKALEIGSKTARSNLSRTFAIKPMDTEILDVQPSNFQLDTGVFREPFARSKLRNFAQEVYIQKKGGVKEPTIKGASLSSYGERKEIQMFRRNKNKKIASRKQVKFF